MNQLKSIRQLLIRSAALWPLLACSGLRAQEGQEAAEATPTTGFMMFFWNKDDLLGTIIIWVLFLMSLMCIGYTLHLVLKYRRKNLLPTFTLDKVRQFLDEKEYRSAIDLADMDPSFMGRLLSSALNEASNGFSAMERAVEETADAETTRILRPIEYLNVVGNIAPMMGLFGTVYGMIVAFSRLVAAGGKADPARLAGGISTALVTTFWGLVVAIPALAAYALIRNKIDALTAEGLILAEELIHPFKPVGKIRKSLPSTAPESSERQKAQPKPD